MNCSECNGKRTQNPFIKNGLFITFNKRNTAFLRSPTWFSGDVVKYFFFRYSRIFYLCDLFLRKNYRL